MYKCAHCRSLNTQVQGDTYSCMNCGELTTFTGTTIGPEDRQVDRFINEPPNYDYAPHGSPVPEKPLPEGPPGE